MLTVVRCCATPEPKAQPVLKLPKRLARARRVVESKRMDSFKAFHEALKKTAKEEQKFIKDFFSNTREMWKDEDAEAAADEEEAENEEE